jgi:hypothetical protein
MRHTPHTPIILNFTVFSEDPSANLSVSVAHSHFPILVKVSSPAPIAKIAKDDIIPSNAKNVEVLNIADMTVITAKIILKDMTVFSLS